MVQILLLLCERYGGLDALMICRAIVADPMICSISRWDLDKVGM